MLGEEWIGRVPADPLWWARMSDDQLMQWLTLDPATSTKWFREVKLAEVESHRRLEASVLLKSPQ